MHKKKIGIVGATGYTGSELVRILHHHPFAEVSTITSESRAGELFSEVHPAFEDIADHRLVSADEIGKEALDLLFLALPHGVSMNFVKKFGKSYKIIDLSGDFRLDSPEVYKEWYGKEHVYPEGFSEAVFGLPELFADEIRQARLIANPGCYPTSALLALAPLLKNGLIAPAPVIVDSKSGVTGAGIQAKPVNLFSNVHDNFKAYALKTHRHTIEIEGTLDRVSGKKCNIQFTPHLLPVDRGILSTVYAQPAVTTGEDELRSAFEEYYAGSPFVRIRKTAPAIKQVDRKSTRLNSSH